MNTNEIEELKNQVLTLISFHNVSDGLEESVSDLFALFQAFPDDKVKSPSSVFMKFKDLPKGARFKYPDGNDVWVAIETYGNGIVAKWEGLQCKGRQSLCCFVDDEWRLDSVVEVV